MIKKSEAVEGLKCKMTSLFISNLDIEVMTSEDDRRTIHKINFDLYSALQWNSPLANFQKIGVAVSWVNIKVWSVSHLKAFTAAFKLM